MGCQVNLEFDYEGASTPMGPNGPRSALIYHGGTIYEYWISSRFIFVHKRVLVITQSFIGNSEQGF